MGKIYYDIRFELFFRKFFYYCRFTDSSCSLDEYSGALKAPVRLFGNQ